jgi:hypothetical protein
MKITTQRTFGSRRRSLADRIAFVTEPMVGSGSTCTRSRPAAAAPGRHLLDGQDGLAGHSDGDVVCHALADALLGAAASGTSGSTSPTRTRRSPASAGSTCSAGWRASFGARARTGVCGPDGDRRPPRDRPDPGRDAHGLAQALGVAAERVSVKATRPEGLGLTDEGVGCIAIAVLTNA